MFYFEPPRGVMSLKNFEYFATVRLNFLIKVMKSGNQTHKFHAILSTPDIVMDSDVLLEGSTKDLISHFTLRLLLANEIDSCNFVLHAESRLFRFRLKCMNDQELCRFLSYTEQRLKRLQDSAYLSSSEYSVVDQIQNIFAQIKTSHGRWRKVVALSHERKSNLFFSVPFSVVPHLVAKRMVTLEGGQALVPFHYLHEVLEHCFELSLHHGLQKCKSDQEGLDKRCKILRHRLQVILRNTYKLHSSLTCLPCATLTQREVMTESEFFPPCMVVLLQNLHTHHRLHHHSRIQLTLFMKEIGMPVHEAIQFWRHYYSQAATDTSGCLHKWEGNERRYQYSIRHLYGLEGSHINYRAHGCVSLQENFTPPYGGSGGCPFKHFDDPNLTQYLSGEGITDIEDILDLRQQGHFSTACAQYLQRKAGKQSQSPVDDDSILTEEPRAKRTRFEDLCTDDRLCDKSFVSPGNTEEKQVTKDCRLHPYSTQSKVNTETDKDIEISNIECVSKQWKANSKRPLCGETQNVRKIPRECERCKENQHASFVSVQFNEKTFFSRKLENTVDMDHTGTQTSERKTGKDKLLPCYCRDHCTSQNTTEGQSSAERNVETDYSKPIVKPSDFYVSFKNLCNNLRTPGSER